jgi:adenosylcobinamide kinase / adenosylcobinamide-phosphate guanylyltransferase
VRTLVLGGARSGKSAFAESLAAPADGAGPVRYLATARPVDAEMAERIRRHRARRPRAWEVVEVEGDLAGALTGWASGPVPPAGGTVLVDGLALWLATLLEHAEDPMGPVEAALKALEAAPRWIVVSEEVGGGLVPTSALGRRFRDLAGEVNQRVAAISDTVYLVTAGIPQKIKAPA